MLIRLTVVAVKKGVCVKYSECLFEDFLFSGLGACAVLCFCLWLVSLILMFYIISNTAPFQKKINRESAS